MANRIPARNGADPCGAATLKGCPSPPPPLCWICIVAIHCFWHIIDGIWQLDVDETRKIQVKQIAAISNLLLNGFFLLPCRWELDANRWLLFLVHPRANGIC